MSTHTCNKRRAIAPALGLFILAISSNAGAIPLALGGAGAPAGENLGGAPYLAGTTVANVNVPFNCSTGLSGTLRSFVVQESTAGFLDFYYYVVNSTAGLPIDRVIATNYAVASLDVDYRTDSIGLRVPTNVAWNATGVEWDFGAGFEVQPAEDTHFLLAHTDHTAYDAMGTVTLFSGTVSCLVSGTFEPL